jgi:hypothetical protein
MKRSGRPFQSIGTRMRGFGRSILRSYLPPEQAASPEGAPVPPPAWMAGSQVPLNWPEEAAPPEMPPAAEAPFEEPAPPVDEYAQPPARRPPAQRPPAQNPPPAAPVQRQPAPPPAKKSGDKIDARLLAILNAHENQDAERERIREQRRKELGNDIQRTAENPSARRRRASFDYVETSTLKSLDKGETASASNETPSKPPAGDDDEDSSPAGAIQRTAAETSEPDAAPPGDTLRPDVVAAIAAAESPSGYTPPGAIQRAPEPPAESPDGDAAVTTTARSAQPSSTDNPSLARRSPVNDGLPPSGNEAVQRSADDEADDEVWADGPFDAADVEDSFALPPQASLTSSPSDERTAPPPPTTPRRAAETTPDMPSVQRTSAEANQSPDRRSVPPSRPPQGAVSAASPARADGPVVRRAPDASQHDDSQPADTGAWSDVPANAPAETGWNDNAAYSEDSGAGQVSMSDEAASFPVDAARAAHVPPVQRAPAADASQPPAWNDDAPAGYADEGAPAWADQPSDEMPGDEPADADVRPSIQRSAADGDTWQLIHRMPADELTGWSEAAPDAVPYTATGQPPADDSWTSASYSPANDIPADPAPSGEVVSADAAPERPSRATSAPPVQRAPADGNAPEAPTWDAAPAEDSYTAEADWQPTSDDASGQLSYDAQSDAPAWQDTPFYPADADAGDEPVSYLSEASAAPADSFEQPRAAAPTGDSSRGNPPPVQRTPADGNAPEAPAWNDAPAEDSYTSETDWQPTADDASGQFSYDAQSNASAWQDTPFYPADADAGDEPASYLSDESVSPAGALEQPPHSPTAAPTGDSRRGNPPPVQRTPADGNAPEAPAETSTWNDVPAEDSYTSEMDWQPSADDASQFSYDAQSDASAWQDTPFYPADAGDEPASYQSDASAAPADAFEQPPPPRAAAPTGDSRRGNPPPVQRTPADGNAPEAPAWDDAPAEDSFNANWQPTSDDISQFSYDAQSDASAWQDTPFYPADADAGDEPASYLSEASAAPADPFEQPPPPPAAAPTGDSSRGNPPPVQRTPADGNAPEAPAAETSTWDAAPAEDSYNANWQQASDTASGQFSYDAQSDAAWQDTPFYPADADAGDEPASYLSDASAAPADAFEQPPRPPTAAPTGDSRRGNPPPVQRTPADGNAPEAPTAEASTWNDAPVEDSYNADWQPASDDASGQFSYDAESDASAWQDSAYTEADTTADYREAPTGIDAAASEYAPGTPPVQRTPADSGESGQPAEPGMDLYEALMAAGAWAAERPVDYTADMPPARADAAPLQRTPSDTGDEPRSAEQSAADEAPGMDVFQALMAAGALPGQPVQRTPSDEGDDYAPQSSEDADSPEPSIDLYRALQAVGAVPKESGQPAPPPPGRAVQRTPADAERAELERLLDLKPPPAATRPAPPDIQPGVMPGPTVQRAENSDAGNDDGGSGVDLDKLARDVYSVLRDRLRIERERRSKP